jgi:hypothetical protein
MISTLLGGRVSLYVPTCAVHELMQMCKEAPELRPAVALARTFKQHKDDSSASEPSSECLLRQIGMAFAASVAGFLLFRLRAK